MTERTWKCDNIKFLLHANIGVKKAALVMNYFFRRSTFILNHFCPPPSVILDQINTDVLLRRVSYQYLATFM